MSTGLRVEPSSWLISGDERLTPARHQISRNLPGSSPHPGCGFTIRLQKDPTSLPRLIEAAPDERWLTS